MLFRSSLYSERIRHVVGPTAASKLEQITVGIRSAVEYIKTKLAEDMARLQAQAISPTAMAQIVLGLKSVSQTKKDKLIARIADERLRRLEDRPNTMWSLWNMVNEVMRERSRSEVRQATLNIGLMDQLLQQAA